MVLHIPPEVMRQNLGKNPLRNHQLSLKPQTLAECSTSVSCTRSKLICWYSICRGTNPILRNKLRFQRAYLDWPCPALSWELRAGHCKLKGIPIRDLGRETARHTPTLREREATQTVSSAKILWLRFKPDHPLASTSLRVTGLECQKFSSWKFTLAGTHRCSFFSPKSLAHSTATTNGPAVLLVQLCRPTEQTEPLKPSQLREKGDNDTQKRTERGR